MAEQVKFNLEITMPKHWTKKFFQMLDCMRWCGNVGASRTVGFYADGDGDFRQFDFKLNGEEVDGLVNWFEEEKTPLPDPNSDEPTPEFKTRRGVDFFFDAE